jgi:hypothetical protein
LRSRSRSKVTRYQKKKKKQLKANEKCRSFVTKNEEKTVQLQEFTIVFGSTYPRNEAGLKI